MYEFINGPEQTVNGAQFEPASLLLKLAHHLFEDDCSYKDEHATIW